MPDSVAESAAIGSTTPLVDTLSVKNVGGGSLSWTARTLHASPWLTLQPDSGVAGSALGVRDDPTGLALGEYRDTVVVSGSTGGIIEVGVVLRIHP
jgi:BACON domain-containing protein